MSLDLTIGLLKHVGSGISCLPHPLVPRNLRLREGKGWRLISARGELVSQKETLLTSDNLLTTLQETLEPGWVSGGWARV